MLLTVRHAQANVVTPDPNCTRHVYHPARGDTRSGTLPAYMLHCASTEFRPTATPIRSGATPGGSASTEFGRVFAPSGTLPAYHSAPPLRNFAATAISPAAVRGCHAGRPVLDFRSSATHFEQTRNIRRAITTITSQRHRPSSWVGASQSRHADVSIGHLIGKRGRPSGTGQLVRR